MEIISPDSGENDRVLKFNLYEKAGVKEYWLIQPDEKVLTVFKIGEDGKYGRPESYSEEHSVSVGIFEDLAIDLKPVFAE